ncbi:MAG: hypothetical protein LBD93_03575 [Treponema sp.]|nr:hypothetical protein [Treponema sp.]
MCLQGGEGKDWFLFGEKEFTDGFVDKLILDGPLNAFGKRYRRFKASRLYAGRIKHGTGAKFFMQIEVMEKKLFIEQCNFM